MVYIITSGGAKYGKSRAEIERNLRKDGMSTMDDGDLAKCEYLEKKSEKEFGGTIFVNKGLINSADKITE